jgi:hypothetical protein
MSARSCLSFVLAVMIGGAATGRADAAAAESQSTEALVGTWELRVDNAASACRVLLRPDKSDRGDYGLGMPAACRYSMRDLARIERWAMPDANHLALMDPTGTPILVLATASDGFSAAFGDRVYTLREIATRNGSPAAFSTLEAPASAGFAPIIHVSKRARAATSADTTPSDLGGRYAIMREKRDTGCMLTLDDKSRVRGGERAQLAPGCRDQGIVIFDPTAWQVVNGELVLTARAGHTARFQKVGEGSWRKDTKDGGKPLGLKKL